MCDVFSFGSFLDGTRDQEEVSKVVIHRVESSYVII